MAPSTRRLLFIAIGGIALTGIGIVLLRPAPRLPPPSYVGTQTCAGCHQQAYDNWLQSDHRHAMEVADARSVLGNFNNASFDYFGTTSRFSLRDGQYFVETDNAQGKLQSFRIAYTFGHYPLQQYLIAFPGGRMQALGISWDSRPAAQGGQRWYHLYPDSKVDHDDPLHWTGAFQNWNSRCAGCHSTNLEKNYSLATDTYQTRWQEISVGCEACHGPGSRHVAWAKDHRPQENKGLVMRIGKVWEPAGGRLPIPALADSTPGGQVQLCASCHSRRSELRHPELAAGYFDNFSLSPLLEDRYFADGQMREEVYVTGSFLQSRMHQNHVSCTNCHEPHSSRLRVAGNGLCLQCHESQKFQSREHFFHEPDSPGAQCVNCHMPAHTYMGVDVRRDHSFRIPDPVASVELGVPNACTQCHTNRKDQWAADFLTRRNGLREPYYPHARLLTSARRGSAAIAPALLAYAQDTGRPPILRSIALLESARFTSPQQLDTAAAALSSSDPLIRIGGVAALGHLQPRERLMRLQSLLADPVKAVRMTVARQLADMALTQAPAEMRAALGKLFDEYRQSLLYNADMPESMNDLGLFQAAQSDLEGAEKSLLHARKLAPRYLPAMLNLADLYRERSRDDLGEPLLREAMAAYPESGDARHMLGLLYVRSGRTPQSVPLFEQASRLAPDNPQYALVYAVALVETGRRTEGLRALQVAARRFPGDSSIRQAIEGYQSQ